MERPRTTLVFVAGIPRDCTEEVLKNHFSDIGIVENVEFKFTKEGQQKGCAILKFATPDLAEKALAKHESILAGRHIDVELARSRGDFLEMRKRRFNTNSNRSKCQEIIERKEEEKKEERKHKHRHHKPHRHHRHHRHKYSNDNSSDTYSSSSSSSTSSSDSYTEQDDSSESPDEKRKHRRHHSRPQRHHHHHHKHGRSRSRSQGRESSEPIEQLMESDRESGSGYSE